MPSPAAGADSFAVDGSCTSDGPSSGVATTGSGWGVTVVSAASAPRSGTTGSGGSSVCASTAGPTYGCNGSVIVPSSFGAVARFGALAETSLDPLGGWRSHG